MKILIVNWSWYPTGGDWSYVSTLINFYESKGHQVIPFSMYHENIDKNVDTKYFISKIDYKDLNNRKSIVDGITTVARSIYSLEAKVKLKKILAEHKVDVAHFNNVHHYLTASSIVPVLKSRGIPIVWTLHDFVILCPNTVFVSNNSTCEKCKGGKFYNCVTKRCKKNSIAASIVASLESYTNLLLNPYKDVSVFICPSKFLLNKFIEFGFESKRLVHLYNSFVNPLDNPALYSLDKEPSNAPNNYILYIGNILKIKGVATLIKAVKNLNVDLVLAGRGEYLVELLEYKAKHSLDNVVFVGQQDKRELFKLIQGARFVVAPSECYENLPYAVIESMMLSKPVLGAAIGGIPELVLDDITGYLFTPGDVTDLRQKLKVMLTLNDCKMAALGMAAKKHILQLTNYDNFKIGMIDIFSSIGLTL